MKPCGYSSLANYMPVQVLAGPNAHAGNRKLFLVSVCVRRAPNGSPDDLPSIQAESWNAFCGYDQIALQEREREREDRTVRGRTV